MEDRDLKDLGEMLSNLRNVLGSRAVLNTQRLLILVALHLSGRLVFTDLSRVTGIGKGSLEHHVSILEKEGLVRRRRHLTILGPRLYIEITDKGRDVLRELIKLLSKALGT